MEIGARNFACGSTPAVGVDAVEQDLARAQLLHRLSQLHRIDVPALPPALPVVCKDHSATQFYVYMHFALKTRLLSKAHTPVCPFRVMPAVNAWIAPCLRLQQAS